MLKVTAQPRLRMDHLDGQVAWIVPPAFYGEIEPGGLPQHPHLQVLSHGGPKAPINNANDQQNREIRPRLTPTVSEPATINYRPRLPANLVALNETAAQFSAVQGT